MKKSYEIIFQLKIREFEMDPHNNTKRKLNKQNKKVAIIIPSYNASILLKNVINTIKMTTNYTNYEIIVVDDGGTDNTSEMLKNTFPLVKIIRNDKNSGFPISVNRGIREFYADYYFILNNDILIVSENWLNDLLRVMNQNSGIGIIAGNLENIFGMKFSENTYKKYLKLWVKEKNREISLQYVFNLGAAAILIKREALRSVGLFDEGFSPGYYEDEDLCARMTRNNWKLCLIKGIKMLHFPSSTFSTIYSAEFLHFYLLPRNRMRFILKHHPLKNLLYEPFLLMKSFFHILFLGSLAIKKQKTYYLMRAIKYNLKFIRNRQLLFNREKKL